MFDDEPSVVSTLQTKMDKLYWALIKVNENFGVSYYVIVNIKIGRCLNETIT